MYGFRKAAVSLTVAIVVACGSSSNHAEEPGIEAIFLRSGYESDFSDASAVSGDGSVVVGQVWNQATTRTEAFRWTPADGIETLGTLGGFLSSAAGVSDDGTVIAGYSHNGMRQRAFRWELGQGPMVDLGTIDGSDTNSFASGISGDGTTIVGWSDSVGGRKPIRWTSGGGLQELPLPVAATWTELTAISRDGSLIVGNVQFAGANANSATRWTMGAFERLEKPNDFGSSLAYAVSSSGESVAGYVSQGGACTWDASGRIHFLEDYGASSRAEVMSGNGRVVVGILDSETCLWIDGTPHPFWKRLTDAGVDLQGWNNLNVRDCSDDGRVLVGVANAAGYPSSVAFRAVLPNVVPIVDAPQTVAVECEGGQNLVTLSAFVDDVEESELTVEWEIDGATLQTNVLAAGSTSAFEYDFPHGSTEVTVRVSDGEDVTTAGTTVTVEDTTAPIVVVAPDIELTVNPRKTFASSSRLPPPDVTDACDGEPLVAHDAPAQLPIGRRTITWTAIDEEGNVATAKQKVTVVNRPPVANAGADVTRTVATKSVAVTLNGVRSSDPDKHKLTYRWTAPRVRFDDPKAVRPTGTFPVGTTEAKLTVTDAAGATSTDVVVVTVKPKATKKRSRAAIALEHTAASLRQGEAAASGSAAGNRILVAVELSRRAYAQGAKALAADDLGDESRSARLLQALSVSNLSAAERYLKVYAATGDEFALAAGRHAFRAAAFAATE